MTVTELIAALSSLPAHMEVRGYRIQCENAEPLSRTGIYAVLGSGDPHVRVTSDLPRLGQVL